MPLVILSALFVLASAQADILIHPGKVDFTAAEDFPDGMILVRVVNRSPFEEYGYLSTDNGIT